ncbi:transporter substrate-binding domain-containing protein [Fusobacterium sp.]|uniref:transporter substrate-binding domain-containing protein n=1 Tax=Fusobacterium sp. TaxID=68766 RepID=UPI00262AACC9|nr:transporter substrate-binding domain-containing protein [Fusobacterium sp.]
MKKIFLVSMLMLGILGCEKNSEKIYVIGTNAEYPPFEYMENGKISGLDAEIIEKISQKTGIKYKWSNMNFDGLIPALQTKKLDIVIAGMSATPEREKAVKFSVPYLTSNATIITNKINPIKNMNDLSGKNYGVELGTTKEVAARKINDAKVTPFSSNTGAIVALKSGKIDGMVLDESVAKKFVEKNKDLVIVGNLTGEPKAIAFNKDEKDLKETFDKAIEELLKDGTIEKLKVKYEL